MKRKMTTGEVCKVAYFAASLAALCVFCECLPLAIVSVLNMAVAASLLRTINVDELIDD